MTAWQEQRWHPEEHDVSWRAQKKRLNDGRTTQTVQIWTSKPRRKKPLHGGASDSDWCKPMGKESTVTEDGPVEEESKESHDICQYVVDLPTVCANCEWEIPRSSSMKGCNSCSQSWCLTCKVSEKCWTDDASDELAREGDTCADRIDVPVVPPPVFLEGSLDGSAMWHFYGSDCAEVTLSTDTETSSGGHKECASSSDTPTSDVDVLDKEIKELEEVTGEGASESEDNWDGVPADVVWSSLQFGLEICGETPLVDCFCSYYLAELAGDETMIGSDGEEYEIFYPPDGLPDEPEEQPDFSEDCDIVAPVAAFVGSNPSSGSRSEPGDMSSWTGLAASISATLGKMNAPRSNSAELGIGDVLSHMRHVQLARYPARTRLFDEVRSATAKALGKHFCRFALVGSTALGIDTPDSDLDVVAFTQPIAHGDQELKGPPDVVDILNHIASILKHWDKKRHAKKKPRGRLGIGPLRITVIDCTKVPVLNVVETSSEGDFLSLDLTVDQPLGEWHVLWFLSQRSEPDAEPATLTRIPEPKLDGWEQGLEAATLRCVKWWLRRRGIPVSKEGGYPTVTWTLMVVHVIRCSLFISTGRQSGSTDRGGVDEHVLLGAVAAFFDRFAKGGGPVGTLLFEDGMHARFLPHVSLNDDEHKSHPSAAADICVLDPTTTRFEDVEWGVQPTDLANRISAATLLLHSYELHRAAKLSAVALRASEGADGLSGGDALRALFADVAEGTTVVPVSLPLSQKHDVHPVFVLLEGELRCGLLRRVKPKKGWNAPFLHRGDWKSSMAIQLCSVDPNTGALQTSVDKLTWFSPCDFVCSARPLRYASAPEVYPSLCLDQEDLERWCEMQTFFAGCAPAHPVVCDANANHHDVALTSPGNSTSVQPFPAALVLD